MYEYKVLTQKDKWFTGKFDPLMLENAINAYAKEGWRVKGVSTAEIGSGVGNREEIVIILERKINNVAEDLDMDKLDELVLPKI